MRLGAAKRARESVNRRDEFEAPGVGHVFLDKDQAINYAENRASFRSGEIRILDSSGNVDSRRRRGHLHVASFLVGVALLIAACSRPGSTAGSSALKPIDQAALQTVVDTTAQELLIPGAVVLLRTPQGEFTVTYGTTLLGATSPPRADTHFRIASNTKTMTAAVIMQLAQEGKLSLDDPVSKYVPGVPNGDNITIAELLEMRSGLCNYTSAPEVSASLDRDPTKVWSPAEVLAIAFARPPNFPPGTAYEYNNTNYALLGLIAEKVDGRPLAQAMQDRLFGALGMQHTVLPASAVNTIPDPYSHGYLYGSSSVALVGLPPYSPEVQAAAPGRHPPAQRLHGPEPFLCHGGRRRHLHRQRSRRLDPGTGCRPRAQRRISAPLARQLATRGPEQARRPTVRVRHQPTTLGSEHDVFSRRRDPWLQLVHRLRPQQPGDARGLDQSDRIARRTTDGQCHHVESARSDLRAVTSPHRRSIEQSGVVMGAVRLKLIRPVACFSQQTRAAATDRG